MGERAGVPTDMAEKLKAEADYVSPWGPTRLRTTTSGAPVRSQRHRQPVEARGPSVR